MEYKYEVKVKRVKTTKIGDVFVVQIDDHHKKYMQYIASDMEQLNSDVIRAFSKVYETHENPELSQIINDRVDFYAHCVTKSGIRYGFWELVGNIQDVGSLEDILFRTSYDFGDSDIKISRNWRIWKLGYESTDVNKLEGGFRSAYLGMVYAPHRIVERIKTGVFSYSYPEFE
ncbi:MAG: Imm26 family immunity protein [Bacteroidales bacterium]